MLNANQIWRNRRSGIISSTLPALLFTLIVFSQAGLTRAQTTSDNPPSAPPAKPTRTYPEKAPEDPFKARIIPRNSKVYIAPMLSEDATKPQAQGFETYLAAALRKKDVPLLIVADESMADFIIEGTADQKGAGWAKKVFMGDFRKSTSSSMTLTNLKTGIVAYADSSDRSSANRGLRSSAEKLAKYLKRKIEDDEKKQH
ncbi:MAG TPA: hypothetical protein VLL54_12520 [Pyrinomonadaceae bacterium]|nr:hypothetical protein [Pyrinomonadaceae bacterium]